MATHETGWRPFEPSIEAVTAAATALEARRPGFTIHIVDAARVIENEIGLGATQASVAKTYALALRSALPQDWTRINAAIRKRWPRGLSRVKESAWRKLEGKEPF